MTRRKGTSGRGQSGRLGCKEGRSSPLGRGCWGGAEEAARAFQEKPDSVSRLGPSGLCSRGLTEGLAGRRWGPLGQRGGCALSERGQVAISQLGAQRMFSCSFGFL